MEIKHTHPEFPDKMQYEEAQKELYRACLAALTALRGSKEAER